jgi:hypothetical protein
MANLQNLKPFQKGHKKLGGRKKGVPNKNSRRLEADFIAAAEQRGSDGQGTGGVVGYLVSLMKNPRHGVRLALAVLNYEAKNPPKDLATPEWIRILMDSPKLTRHDKLFLAQIREKYTRTS